MSNDANTTGANAGNGYHSAWLFGIILLVLLILGAVFAAQRQQQELGDRSAQVLRQQGIEPASLKLSFDGRDALLQAGHSQAAQLQQARDLLEPLWGVRRVSTRATAETAAIAGKADTDQALAALPVSRAGPATAPKEAPPSESPGGAASSPIAEPVSLAAEALDPPPVAAADEVAPATAAGDQAVAASVRTPAPGLAPGTAPPADVTASPSNSVEPGSRSEGVALAPSSAQVPPPAAEQPQVTPPALAFTAPELAASSATRDAPGSKIEAAPSRVPATETVAKATSPEPTPISAQPSPVLAPAPVNGPISTAQLLRDWPDLEAVEDLRVELHQDKVLLRGQVNSQAELERIQGQFPESSAARHVTLDLRLMERNAEQLADYLNLVAASFRFRRSSAQFGTAGERAMDRIAAALKSYPDIRLGLAGQAPEAVNARVRRVLARHRAGAAYHALLKRRVGSERIFLADFVSPYTLQPGSIGAAPTGSGQLHFFSLQR